MSPGTEHLNSIPTEGLSLRAGYLEFVKLRDEGKVRKGMTWQKYQEQR